MSFTNTSQKDEETPNETLNVCAFSLGTLKHFTPTRLWHRSTMKIQDPSRRRRKATLSPTSGNSLEARAARIPLPVHPLTGSRAKGLHCGAHNWLADSESLMPVTPNQSSHLGYG